MAILTLGYVLFLVFVIIGKEDIENENRRRKNNRRSS